MSANYDKSQRFSFVYSNLYQIYKKGKEAAKAAGIPGEPNPHVLKTGSVIREQNFNRKPEVREYKPMELMGKRIKRSVPELEQERKHAAPAESFADPTLKSLRENLNSLNELHARLRFMLKELEDLVRE